MEKHLPVYCTFEQVLLPGSINAFITMYYYYYYLVHIVPVDGDRQIKEDLEYLWTQLHLLVTHRLILIRDTPQGQVKDLDEIREAVEVGTQLWSASQTKFPITAKCTLQLS